MGKDAVVLDCVFLDKMINWAKLDYKILVTK